MVDILKMQAEVESCNEHQQLSSQQTNNSSLEEPTNSSTTVTTSEADVHDSLFSDVRFFPFIVINYMYYKHVYHPMAFN